MATNIAICRIKCILSLKLAKGIFFAKLILKRIELNKLLLSMQIESNMYCFLGEDLNQSQYPQSFHYYDFTIKFINESMPDDRVDFYHKKWNNSVVQYLHDRKVKHKSEKSQCQYSKMLDENTRSLQRSNYVYIDTVCTH